MLTTRISSARATVSFSIRNSVFSRRWTSRRTISRSTAIFERAGVSESGGGIRFTQAGAAGPSCPRSTHQPSCSDSSTVSAQLTCEQLVDRHGVTCEPFRALLIDYLEEPRLRLDYSTLDNLARALTRIF
ncbi:hypothetical protein RKD20_009101 [Streptomyces sp. SLBN-8D4]|jgi:hypothetical protein